MSEAEEELIREQYFLLHSRNTHSKHILERIYKRYMKCIANEKFEAKEKKIKENSEIIYKGGHLG